MAVLKYKDPTSGEWKNLSGYVYLGNDIPVGLFVITPEIIYLMTIYCVMVHLY